MVAGMLETGTPANHHPVPAMIGWDPDYRAYNPTGIACLYIAVGTKWSKFCRHYQTDFLLQVVSNNRHIIVCLVLIQDNNKEIINFALLTLCWEGGGGGGGGGG